MRYAYIAVVILLLLTASCGQTMLHESDRTILLKQQRQELSKIPEQWDLIGRISIIYEQENWHARFHWKKQSNQFQLRFTGPLGETYLVLEQEQDKSSLKRLSQDKPLIEKRIKNTLRIGNEVYVSYGNIEALLAEHSDIAIPINSLQYWIFGHYNPQYPYQIKMFSADDSVTVEDSVAAIDELFQQDWKIQFSRYKQQQAVSYPAKMIARNNEYVIKVFVSSRRFNLNN
ncbi:MAG: outer membrane lipoprotein LolB [Pseudomonadota bacterium]